MNLTFSKNKKKYFFSISFLITITIILFVFGFIWIINPSSYVYWLLPNQSFVFILGALGCFCSFVLLTVVYFSLTNNEFYVKINEKGLFVGTLIYKNKLIQWNDITSINVLDKNNNRYIIINIKNIHNYKERGIRKLLFTLSLKQNGSPYLIHTLALECKFDEIKNAIETGWNKYRSR